MDIVNSFTEWQPLEEVIVGRIFDIRTPVFDKSFRLFYSDNFRDGYFFSDPEFDLPNRFIEEGAEDLEGLVSTLSSHGVIVRRPANMLNGPREFVSPYAWRGIASPALNIRDQCLIWGNHIIETPPLIRSRYFENDQLKPIFYKYFESGARWSSAPRPVMTDASFDDSYVRATAPTNLDPAVASPFDIGHEMMIDAAQCMRFGSDIIVNVANRNHEMGAKWLMQQLPDVHFHIVNLSDSHIDGRLVPLRPGTLLIDARRISDVSLLPPALQKWDIIPVTDNELSAAGYEYEDISLASIAIDINVLSLDEERVIVNKAATKLIRLLDQHGFQPVPVRFRHGRVLGGAFHCVTLDVRRSGGPEHFLES